ncbi:MAG: acyltransferase [Bacteroidales bacterium]|jgi:hypothetical protein|nr:acyltransferase [Bacteroidales bacterium]
MIQELIDEYRPYNDSEVPAALQRIAQDIYFPQIAQFVFPNKELHTFLEEFKQIRTVVEFQEKIMNVAINRVVEKTISRLSYSGIEHLNKHTSYTFISNHRDIMLDSAILQVILFSNNLPTSEITFGNNLMSSQLVIDIGKLNKMFKIVRGGTAREIFINSHNVSAYMRYAITQKHESTWIAQRNGRTKDGNDKTEIAVLKMFAMSSKKSFAENLGELNITPIAVSYEYEPCDFLKTREIYLSRQKTYVKEPGEDFNSIMQGIKQFKGNTHYTICKPITAEELADCEQLPPSEQYKALAAIIDKRIYAGYTLWKTNYMAHDLLHKKSEFADRYSTEECEHFKNYMNKGLHLIDGNCNELQEIFLGIYANPVDKRKM